MINLNNAVMNSVWRFIRKGIEDCCKEEGAVDIYFIAHFNIEKEIDTLIFRNIIRLIDANFQTAKK